MRLTTALLLLHSCAGADPAPSPEIDRVIIPEIDRVIIPEADQVVNLNTLQPADGGSWAHAMAKAQPETFVAGDDLVDGHHTIYSLLAVTALSTDLNANLISIPKGPAGTDPLTDVVALHIPNHGWECSGVLVERDLVLTAKHCLDAGAPDKVLFGADVGQSRLEAKVLGHTPHPTLDVALLNIQRVNLLPRARRRSGDTTPPSGSLLVSGFGANTADGKHGKGWKRRGWLEANGWGCDFPSANSIECDATKELRIVDPLGQWPCKADSGGGLFENLDGPMRLLGIVSRGTDPCGDGAVFVRVDALDNWIQNPTQIPTP